MCSSETQTPANRNFVKDQRRTELVAALADAFQKAGFRIRVSSWLHDDGRQLAAVLCDQRIQFVQIVVVKGQRAAA